MDKPFRWDISKYEQLGRLIIGEKAETYSEFETDLNNCCSRLISFSENSNLVYIGRSPESIFDYLSGMFFESSWKNRSILLNISSSGLSYDNLRKEFPKKIITLRHQFEALNLSPETILLSKRSFAFIDLVYSGSTFGFLIEFLVHWAIEKKTDLKSLKRRIKIIGITIRTKTSPNTWRWQQKMDWVKNHKDLSIKNISIPWDLWNYLGNNQIKVTKSNFPGRWGDEKLLHPLHESKHLEALRLAYYLFKKGRESNNRIYFAELLSKEKEMKEGWLRSLVMELKGH